MRVLLEKDEDSESFSEDLLKIGEDEIEIVRDGKIDLSRIFYNILEKEDNLIDTVYPDLEQNYLYDEWLHQRPILAPENSVVNDVNKSILQRIPEKAIIYSSIDSVVNPEKSSSYPIEFLNSIDMSGIPSHELELKVGVPFILMRNIAAPKLCNGTRLQITKLGKNIIEA